MTHTASKNRRGLERAAEDGVATLTAGLGSRRFRVCWDAVVRGADCDGNAFEEAAKTEYISATGACLSMPTNVRSGSPVEVSIRVPLGSHNWMNYSAKVVRVKKGGPSGSVAIEFISARPLFVWGDGRKTAQAQFLFRA